MAKTLETSYPDSGPRLLMPVSISERITFVTRKGRYSPARQCKLKNSLLAGVGYLELANAADFAANVWNEVPVPHFAMALMAVGGTFTLIISCFAFKDVRLSWRNVLLLLDERSHLRRQKVHYAQDKQSVRALDCHLDVNSREMGAELTDRIGMDILMGFGAVLVGIGTFMAIGGANPSVHQASNLLSGYIGNGPTALYGTINALWSAHGTVNRLLKDRLYTVKIHAAMNGMTGVVAGVASLITATMWWGYIVLTPCIISSIFCNYVWRHRIGYDRPLAQQPLELSRVSLVEELEFVTFARKIPEEAPSDSLLKLVSNPESIALVIEFIVKNDLFEDFCIHLLKDTPLSATLFGTLKEELTSVANSP
ncbi:hypothetical protein BJ546DRAFT_1071909 [Cryomyces antarcticus]|uniref:Integral membrane protein n=1 Tax=Cryomyces antarcticus TaxID=329879 RepID=A0ABR0M5N3_9PEZI|nr:hypothetical protein LTR39_004437 [Cryomyces antarcticus]KAK5011965.1 hypothetical protein LTR60_004632 [Cryomyces antarcticus]KAK5284713.1 hypothetical protein LTR16_005035 [Cryomyces antarcticus]